MAHTALAENKVFSRFGSTASLECPDSVRWQHVLSLNSPGRLYSADVTTRAALTQNRIEMPIGNRSGQL